jgi:putative phosphoribosyl transferase
LLLVDGGGAVFVDRADAGRQLGRRLAQLRGPDVVVLGLPRGGVRVAAEVAEALGAPLDVIMVRKLGVPSQPELAMGAIGEQGVRILVPETVRHAGVTTQDLAAVDRWERAELQRRAQRFRGDRTHVPLAGRIAVVVDDGVATGCTARAACQVVRAQGAARVVLAVPVAPFDWVSRLHDVADELIALVTPRALRAIGAWYTDFVQSTDAEVIACLRSAIAG